MDTRWCNSCCKIRVVATTDEGLICCTTCGKVLAEDLFTDEPAFEKDKTGASRISGTLVKLTQSGDSESIDRRLSNVDGILKDMDENMGIGSGDQVVYPAKRFYRIALERNFVQGRRVDVVAAGCLYIACVTLQKPFLLIEFARYVKVSVYKLGVVYVELCKVLHLVEHNFVKRLNDPSLYVHRFVHGLLGKGDWAVERTALKIVTSMKLNWINTGRKPSGVFGAALYVSALSHGYKLSKADVVKIVHICEGTLMKRLIEFEGTEAGGLSVEEFEKKTDELEQNFSVKTGMNVGEGGKLCIEGELLCEHKGSGAVHFAHGLCENCHDEFVKISGGLYGGSDPPAFQRAERNRSAKACSKESVDSLSAVSDEHETVECMNNAFMNADDQFTVNGDSENLSDVDDAEIENCINNAEESKLKKITWEHMNAEYELEQAEKREAAAAGLKVKKERKRKRGGETEPAKTAAEAVQQELSKRRVSSKINFDALKDLFDDSEIHEQYQKSKVVSDAEEIGLTGTHIENEVEAEDHEHQETMGDYEDDGYDYPESNLTYNYNYEEDYEDYGDFDDGLC